ncbi:MAG: hypothetical protein J5554_10950 [Paludibacteraceae bacterium]|nr:hypothetical protein [Paludibacteraceae bacterium]
MNTFYFPIDSSSLAHYLCGACIKAAKYFDNKPQDIQDRYNEFLLLTDRKGTNATDCSLELVLSKEEIDDLIDAKNGWYLLDTKPLPITRIKKILFSNKEQMDNTITNIRMSTAFVPTILLDVDTFDENLVDVQIPADCQSVDQTSKINQYDRFLGALAMMRLAHEPYMNYSQNYFATLSFFNHKIDDQVRLKEGLSLKDAFQGIFNNSKGFEKVLSFLELNIDENALNRIAQENNQVIKKDKITRIIDVESITDTWTYTIAILNEYGVGNEVRKKRIDELIQSHFKSLREGKQEGVALCYGYNRGYSVFTKSYGEVDFKYKLESQLDYYTIESVYQYVFNGKVSSDFPFLDSWCPKLLPKKPSRSTDYVILDELIIGKKKAKVFSQEWWNVFFQKFDFGQLSKPILELVKPIIEKEVYADVKEELQESFQDELDKALSELAESEKTISQLRLELEKCGRSKTNSCSCGGVAEDSIVAEPTSNYGVEDTSDERLKSLVVKFKDFTLGDLKKSIKAKDTTKLREILLNQPTDLFSK